MRLPVPGPADLIHLASSVKDGIRDGAAAASDAADLVPRAAELISRAAALLGRVESLLDAVELLLVRVESVVDSVSETTNDAAATVGTAALVTTKADRLVEGGSGLLDRTDHLLAGTTPVFEQLMPTVQKLADSLSPHEVEAAITLIDRMPLVLKHLDEDVLPVLRQMEAVGPDVHEILEVLDDVRDVLVGLPGVGLLKRMGDRKDLPE